MTENADLLYAGRDRKRPPGASDLVQQIWLLLRDHPEGMTRDQIQAELAEGWLETDAYREYEMRLEHRANGRSRKFRRAPGYGTPEFKEAAQKHAVQRRLKDMSKHGTVRHEIGLWFAARPPRVTKIPDRAAYVPLTQIIDNRDHANRSQVARENLKATCRAVLQDKRNSKGHRALAQEVLDYLSGGTS